jgi:hypothetical protein
LDSNIAHRTSDFEFFNKLLKKIVREIERPVDHLMEGPDADMPPAIHPAIVKQWKEGRADHRH